MSESTAVTVIEQPADSNVVEWSLDNWPVAEWNRLVPVETVQIPTDLLRPVVQAVRLSPDEKAGDVYSSKDMPSGHAAPTRVGLRKLATAAGISFVEERRTDDGSDPDVIEVSVVAEMLLPTGQRIRATGTKRIDLNAQSWNSPAHRAKYKSFFQEHVASRAQNRAIRALLSLRGSYPVETYRKPFAVVSFTPNLGHPEVRARVLDAMAGTVGQLYGPTAAAQLEAGKTINVSPAPDEDPAPTPTALPGEKLAKAEASSTPEEPSWMQEPAAAAAPKKPKADFVSQLRESAATLEGGDELAGAEDLGPVREIFSGWGGLASPGFVAIWNEDGSKPSRGQAHAIATVHDSLGHEAFEREWRKVADQAAVASA